MIAIGYFTTDTHIDNDYDYDGSYDGSGLIVYKAFSCKIALINQ